MAVSLRRFTPIDPHDLITGVLGEWLQIILFCGLFIAIAGAVLPKRLTEKRYGKALVVFTGLILGIGLYMAKNIYNFNFESFGFLAIWLIVILTGFVAYGLMRMGMRGDIALSLTYIVIFLTFFLMTPTLYDSIATSFPLLNGIFILAFGYMVVTLLIKMFGKGKSSKELARDLKPSSTNFRDRIISESIKKYYKPVHEVKKWIKQPRNKSYSSALQLLFTPEKTSSGEIKEFEYDEFKTKGRS